ncbi:hypothetical protein [Sphingomonas insulae]|nr:hypothetical protein [Sphingomonas insulae]
MGDLGPMRAAGIVGAMLATAAVHGQTVPTTNPVTAADPIVVEGRALPDEVKIRALARAISPRVGFDQPLARFTDPVCFATAGLPSPMLRTIGARLAENADAAGIALAGDGCTPNIIVVFVEDSRAEAERLMRRKPWMFRNYQPSEMLDILKEPGPVHVWSVSEVRSRDGDRISQGVDGPPTLRVPIATRIGLAIRRDMLSTVMLVDRKAVLGRSLRQVADYAAMRTLAMIRPKGAAGGDTILTLFDPAAAAPPTEMTAFDRGYLKALYAGSGTQRGATKVAMIARSIIRTAADDNADARRAGFAGSAGSAGSNNGGEQ